MIELLTESRRIQMELVRIHEKNGEEKIIYLGQLAYVGVREDSIEFTFASKHLSYNKVQLGDEEFGRLKSKFEEA